jgi:DNA-binding beta-propeller fold protein YncE
MLPSRLACLLVLALVLAARVASSAEPDSAAVAGTTPLMLDSLGVYGHAGSDDGGLVAPSGLATDQFAHIWVSDASANRLQRWDAAGQWLGQSGSLGSDANQFRRPASVSRLGSAGVAVLDIENRRVVTYDLLGRLAVVLVQLDAAALEEQTGRITPVSLAADRGGALYVADGDRDRVLAFDFAGRLVRTVGSYGAAPGSFRGLASIAVAPHGELVTIERPVSLPRKRAKRANSMADSLAASGARVQRLDAGGAPIASWLVPATSEESFALAVDDSGRVAVTCATAGTVSVYSREGRVLAAREGLAQPCAVAWMPDGALLVAEAGRGRILRVAPAAAKP